MTRSQTTSQLDSSIYNKKEISIVRRKAKNERAAKSTVMINRIGTINSIQTFEQRAFDKCGWHYAVRFLEWREEMQGRRFASH